MGPGRHAQSLTDQACSFVFSNFGKLECVHSSHVSSAKSWTGPCPVTQDSGLRVAFVSCRVSCLPPEKTQSWYGSCTDVLDERRQGHVCVDQLVRGTQRVTQPVWTHSEADGTSGHVTSDV